MSPRQKAVVGRGAGNSRGAAASRRRTRRAAGTPLDTDRKAHEVQIEAYRRMGPHGRTALVFRLNAFARQNTMAGIRARHPDYTEEQVRSALLRLLLGDELARKVWPERELVDP